LKFGRPVAALDGDVDVGDLEELGHVEEDADDRHGHEVLAQPPFESVCVVCSPNINTLKNIKENLLFRCLYGCLNQVTWT